MRPPFVSAPYIHPFNAPKHHALTLRSVQFAKANSRQLLWVTAHDKPVAAGDYVLRGDALRKAREV